MNRLTTALTAALVSLPAVAQAAPAKVATEFAREVASAVLGEGISQALAAAMGASDDPVDLSEEAFNRIGGIVNQAVDTLQFNDAKTHSRDALQNFNLYEETLPGALYTTVQAQQKSIEDLEDIVDDALLAANKLQTVGLRGVPLYQVAASTAVSALYLKRDLVDAANEPGVDRQMTSVAETAYAFLDGQLEDWATQTRASLGSARGAYFYSGLWNDHLRFLNAANRRDLTTAEIFGDVGEVRAALASKADLPNHFANATRTHFTFDGPHGWQNNEVYVRRLGDVNGDGISDLVGFGHRGFGVYIGDGQGGFTRSNTFENASGAFTVAHGWGREHPRFIADMNGDGKDDIVGFAGNGVHVALSDGHRFGPAVRWLDNCGFDHGWRIDRHVRAVADVNGDRRAEIICVDDSYVYVGFNMGTRISPWMQPVTQDLTHSRGGWNVGAYPRTFGDVNGDGLTDMVGFGHGGVYVMLGQGAGFGPQIADTRVGFHYAHGWRPHLHIRELVDMNGDGNDDIVGIGTGDVYVSLSNGDGTFEPATLWSRGFGAGQGWSVGSDLRAFGDFDGDGAADIITSNRWGYNQIAYGSN